MPFKNPQDKLRYDTEYESSAQQKKNRAARGRARYAVEKKVGSAALKGKDIDHKDGNPNNNARSNLRVMSKSRNRGKH